MKVDEFREECQKLGIIISDKQLEYLQKYKELLQEYNKLFNLTAIINDDDIYLKHFYDSLTMIKAVDLQKNWKLLDIGTGAGFPALVLKIVFPNLRVYLLEANTKKITFLNKVIDTLKLENIWCLNKRAEDIKLEERESFDIVTSRAVGQLRILLELAVPYLKIGGLFVPLKANIEHELEESKGTMMALKTRLVERIDFNLPFSEAKRTILVLEKEAKTAEEYPRKYDKIIKKPLK